MLTPRLIKTCNAIQVPAPIHRYASKKRSALADLIANLNIRQINKKNRTINAIDPNKPNSSEKTAKIKSVCASGK